jgi:hypothetical protein
MRIIQIALVVVLLTILVVMVWSFSDEDSRWLLLNRKAAESYAVAILESNSGREVPDKFIDYAISAERGAVFFARHDSDGRMYGYFPKGVGAQDASRLGWRALDDNWYVFNPTDDTGED